MDIYCFVDGGHLRAIARETGRALPNPRQLAVMISYSGLVQAWKTSQPHAKPKGFLQVPAHERLYGLSRIVYYDAMPDDGPSPAIQEYWNTIELLPDTQTGFGALRGKRKRQKRVDSLLAVDMLTGATDGLYRIGILIGADADFVPVVEAVRRRGAMVVVAAKEASLAEDLRRAADRVWFIEPEREAAEFPALSRPGGGYWFEDASGNVTVREQLSPGTSA